MNDLLIEQLESLLNDENNEMSYLVEEVQEEEKNESEGSYKDGAHLTCPAGHKWVYVFAVNSKTFFAKMIISTTRKVFDKKAAACHVSLSFDKSLTKMYSFTVDENFRIENIHTTYKPDATFSLYKIAVPDQVFVAMQDAVKNIAQLKGTKGEYKYHTKGILAFFLGKKYQEKMGSKKGVLFCSQFCARMFATAGMPVFEKEDYKVQPYEFMKNKKFKFCYRGSVRYYNPTKVR